MINFKNIKRKDLKRNLRNVNVPKDDIDNACDVILTHKLKCYHFVTRYDYFYDFFDHYKCSDCDYYLKEIVWPTKIIINGCAVGDLFGPINCKEAIIKKLLE